MRLREYFEIRDGLKSKLREDVQENADLTDLIKDAYANPKPASFINDILKAGYVANVDGVDYGYAAGEARLSTFDDNFADHLVANIKYYKGIEDFTSLIWEEIVDQLGGTGEFFVIKDLPGSDGSIYDFYFAVMPAEDLNFTDFSREIIAVNKSQNTLLVGNRTTYELFDSVLRYIVDSNNITDLDTAAKFFIANYLSDKKKSKITEAGINLGSLATYCDDCSAELGDDAITNIYGETLCDDCWDNYINTDRGSVEYVKGIAEGDDDVTDFDQTQLDRMAKAWAYYKDTFDLTSTEVAALEKQAASAGFIF